MKKPELRLVDKDAAEFSEERSDEEKGQLSLFPLGDVTRLVCFPMAEIHGATFLRRLEVVRASAVIDLRPYPFFDLLGINRSLALDAIHRAVRSYQHFPLDLRAPRDQMERWRVRDQVIKFISDLAIYRRAHGTAFLLLTNSAEEVEVLAQSLQSIQSREFGENAIELVR